MGIEECKLRVYKATSLTQNSPATLPHAGKVLNYVAYVAQRNDLQHKEADITQLFLRLDFSY